MAATRHVLWPPRTALRWARFCSGDRSLQEVEDIEKGEDGVRTKEEEEIGRITEEEENEGEKERQAAEKLVRGALQRGLWADMCSAGGCWVFFAAAGDSDCEAEFKQFAASFTQLCVVDEGVLFGGVPQEVGQNTHFFTVAGVLERAVLSSARRAFDWMLAGTLRFVRMSEYVSVQVQGPDWQPSTPVYALACDFRLYSDGALQCELRTFESGLVPLASRAHELDSPLQGAGLAVAPTPYYDAAKSFMIGRPTRACAESVVAGCCADGQNTSCSLWKSALNIHCPLLGHVAESDKVCHSHAESRYFGHTQCCSSVMITADSGETRRFPLFMVFAPRPPTDKRSEQDVASTSVFRSCFAASTHALLATASGVVPSESLFQSSDAANMRRLVSFRKIEALVVASSKERMRRLTRPRSPLVAIPASVRNGSEVRALMVDAEPPYAARDITERLGFERWQALLLQHDSVRASGANLRVTFARSSKPPTRNSGQGIRPTKKRKAIASSNDGFLVVEPSNTIDEQEMTLVHPPRFQDDHSSELTYLPLMRNDSDSRVLRPIGSPIDFSSESSSPPSAPSSDDLANGSNLETADFFGGNTFAGTLISLSSIFGNAGEDFFQLLSFLNHHTCTCRSCGDPRWSQYDDFPFEPTIRLSPLPVLSSYERAKNAHRCMITRLSETFPVLTTPAEQTAVAPPTFRVHTQNLLRSANSSADADSPIRPWIVAAPMPILRWWEQSQLAGPRSKSIVYACIYPTVCLAEIDCTDHVSSMLYDSSRDDEVRRFLDKLSSTFAACGMGALSPIKAPETRQSNLSDAVSGICVSSQNPALFGVRVNDPTALKTSEQIRAEGLRLVLIGQKVATILRAALVDTISDGVVDSELCIILVNPFESAFTSASALDASERQSATRRVSRALANFVNQFHHMFSTLPFIPGNKVFVKILPVSCVAAKSSRERTVFQDIAFDIYSRSVRISAVPSMPSGDELASSPELQELPFTIVSTALTLVLHVAYCVCSTRHRWAVSMTDEIGSFTKTVVLSSHPTGQELVSEALAVVKASVTKEWELCVVRVDSAPSDEEARDIIDAATRRHGFRRITVSSLQSRVNRGAQYSYSEEDHRSRALAACNAMYGASGSHIPYYNCDLISVDASLFASASMPCSMVLSQATIRSCVQAEALTEQTSVSVVGDMLWVITTVDIHAVVCNDQTFLQTQANLSSLGTTIATDFAALSWLTASPLWPNRRSALPIHVDRAIRALRVALLLKPQQLASNNGDE